MSFPFDLQGHRGARGLKPENTLPSFETAFDLGVTSVETDIHLSRDGVPVLYHDPAISERLCRLLPGSRSPDPATRPAVRLLSLDQWRGYQADLNPDGQRFPEQNPRATPLARLFAERHGFHPLAPPTLKDLLEFAAAYAGDLGALAGKTEKQRTRVREMRFDLELKRVPFRPEFIGDGFDGTAPALLERRLVETIAAAGVAARTLVRSFDHRSVGLVRQLEPQLTAVVLIAGTAPIAPVEIVRQADAQVYGPEVDFLDEGQVRQLHAAGLRVIPWTVNAPADWARLLDWGVDGITTDYPDRLADFLHRRGVGF